MIWRQSFLVIPTSVQPGRWNVLLPWTPAACDWPSRALRQCCRMHVFHIHSPLPFMHLWRWMKCSTHNQRLKSWQNSVGNAQMCFIPAVHPGEHLVLRKAAPRDARANRYALGFSREDRSLPEPVISLELAKAWFKKILSFLLHFWWHSSVKKCFSSSTWAIWLPWNTLPSVKTG